MQIEHVARIRFAAGRTPQQQGNFTISDGVLGKIVVDDQRVTAVVAEVFAHRGGGIGSQVLHGSRFRGSCRDYDGVVHGAVFGQGPHHLSHRRSLLADRAVDADQDCSRDC